MKVTIASFVWSISHVAKLYRCLFDVFWYFRSKTWKFSFSFLSLYVAPLWANIPISERSEMRPCILYRVYPLQPISIDFLNWKNINICGYNWESQENPMKPDNSGSFSGKFKIIGIIDVSMISNFALWTFLSGALFLRIRWITKFVLSFIFIIFAMVFCCVWPQSDSLSHCPWVNPFSNSHWSVE